LKSAIQIGAIGFRSLVWDLLFSSLYSYAALYTGWSISAYGDHDRTIGFVWVFLFWLFIL